jgi:hypothetical protein
MIASGGKQPNQQQLGAVNENQQQRLDIGGRSTHRNVTYSLASALVSGSAVEGGENQSAITLLPLGVNSTREGSNIIGGSTVSNHLLIGVVEYQVGNHGYITLHQGNNGIDEGSVVTEATPHRLCTNHRGNVSHNDRLTTIENQLTSFSTALQSIQHQLSGSTGQSQIISLFSTTT